MVQSRHQSAIVIEWRNLALFAAALALLCALFLLLQLVPREANRPLTQGTIKDTRIVADHAVETNWGGQLTWTAEYRVIYFVNNREYAVWTNSGIRGESEAGVQLALPKSHPPCRVKYNPKIPAVSVADCRWTQNETQ